ncbi:MAG: ribonuclease D [Acidimicrobiales bacterium]
MTTAIETPSTFIADDAQFASLIDRLVDKERYAVDTEFHRERTYFPQVALVQIADDEGVALIDALAVDLAPFARVLEGPGLAVMHAARQDMEVLDRACGIVPSRLVDTQLVAGFLGYTSPSLATLMERELKVRLPKADRLTDWLRRPLGSAQLAYAAADVSRLLELYDQLWARIEERGRAPWVLEACEELRTEYRGPRDPDEAWRRIKELRHLKGSTLAVAQAVASWRELRAIETDQTPRFVLSDLAVVSVASAAPTDIDELRSLRGIDGRNLRGGLGEDLLRVVKDSQGSVPTRVPTLSVPELSAELRPAVPLISAWVSQRSRELELETALLATRSDLEDLLRGVPEARLTHGWRAEIVGEPIRKLVAGEATLAFERSVGLILEDRTR